VNLLMRISPKRGVGEALNIRHDQSKELANKYTSYDDSSSQVPTTGLEDYKSGSHTTATSIRRWKDMKVSLPFFSHRNNGSRYGAEVFSALVVVSEGTVSGLSATPAFAKCFFMGDDGDAVVRQAAPSDSRNIVW
jgi:hypothetical protein